MQYHRGSQPLTVRRAWDTLCTAELAALASGQPDWEQLKQMVCQINRDLDKLSQEGPRRQKARARAAAWYSSGGGEQRRAQRATVRKSRHAAFAALCPHKQLEQVKNYCELRAAKVEMGKKWQHSHGDTADLEDPDCPYKGFTCGWKHALYKKQYAVTLPIEYRNADSLYDLRSKAQVATCCQITGHALDEMESPALKFC